MDFALTDDHLALRDAVQRFCDGEYPSEHRGNPETPEQARQRWQAMAALGLHGLPLPTDCGGSELGPVEVMLVAQEFGRALGGGAWLSNTVMAAHLLTHLGTPNQCQAWLSAIATGELQASVAVYDAGVRYDWHHVTTSAQPVAGGYMLNGQKALVLHGDTAGLLLVVARTGGDATDRKGLAVFAIDAGTSGLQVAGFDTLDGRRAARVTLDNVLVAADRLLIGTTTPVADALDAMLDAANAALCAEAAGAVEALIHHTAEHLRTRKQFGAPLAKFQVLQHRLADMVIGLEQLKSMACAATAALHSTDTQQRRRVVSAAKVFSSQQGRQIGLAAIQMHGGMGMTDECRVGHYTKRLMVIGQLLGDHAWHLKRLIGAS
jgi:pimeloyl-CoA dehydrogenase